MRDPPAIGPLPKLPWAADFSGRSQHASSAFSYAIDLRHLERLFVFDERGEWEGGRNGLGDEAFRLFLGRGRRRSSLVATHLADPLPHSVLCLF